MKSNVYIITVLVALTIHTATWSMQFSGIATDKSLLEASKTGNMAQIMRLLENGSNIDTTDANGTQPIHYAAQRGHTETVELLLDRGSVGIDSPDKWSRQPLHLAALNNHTVTVELLLDRGATGIDASDRWGRHPLHYVAYNGHMATVKLVLDRGATGIDAPDNDGCQPLHLAVRNGHTATVELLLDRGATGIDSPDKYGWQLLHHAAQNGHTEAVELLLDRGATGIDAPDKHGWQPLHYAAWNGHTATVELLLDRGPTGLDASDIDGKQPLHWAAQNGHTATVELLLDQGATGLDASDKYANQPIHYAAQNGHTATVFTLISHGAIIPDTMPLYGALAEVFAQPDFTSILPIPFHSGTKKTVTLSDVISMAAGQNKQETVEIILRMHRTNLTDRNFIDALTGSATAGHDAMVCMLHDEMSNNRNLRSLVPETLARALSRAVAHCRVDVIRYLIEQDSIYDRPTFSLLRPAGTLLRHRLSPYSPSEIHGSERLNDYKRILTMLCERQCWRCHTLPLLGRAQAASVEREETVSYVPSPIISVPIELWLIILNYLADRHLYEIAK